MQATPPPPPPPQETTQASEPTLFEGDDEEDDTRGMDDADEESNEQGADVEDITEEIDDGNVDGEVAIEEGERRFAKVERLRATLAIPDRMNSIGNFRSRFTSGSRKS